MDTPAILWNVLTAGAALAASGAVGEFAKSGGKAAFEALKDRLTGKGADSVALLAKAADNPAYAEAIRADLAKPGITGDPDILAAAETLRAALAELPSETLAAYAIDVGTLRAGGNILIETAEGLRANVVDATGDVTLRNISAPGEKKSAAGGCLPVSCRVTTARRLERSPPGGMSCSRESALALSGSPSSSPSRLPSLCW
jgi:hypothetical protein